MPAGAGAKPGPLLADTAAAETSGHCPKNFLELPQTIQESSTAGNCTGFILLLSGAHPALLELFCRGCAGSWASTRVVATSNCLLLFSSKALGCPLPLQFLSKANAQSKAAFGYFRVLGAKTLLGQLGCACWEILVIHG